MSVEREGYSDEETYPREKIRKILNEFSAREKGGGAIESEAEKAAFILSYIQYLQDKRAKEGQPMTERDTAALGFDIDALRKGILSASPVHHQKKEEGDERETQAA